MRVFARGAERVEVAVDDRVVTVRRWRGEMVVDEAKEQASSAIKAKWDADRRCKRLVADGFVRVAGTDEPIAASQRELVAAIEANPDELDTYLVLADWLSERGDPWGQLIAVQHALATLPRFRTAERRAELEREEVRVLFQHASRIWGALGETIVDEATQRYASDLVNADWRCGFLFGARLRGEFVEVWERLMPMFARLDITAMLRVLSVDLFDEPQRMLQLLARETWPQLTSLAISAHRPFDPYDLLPFFHSDRAPELVELQLLGTRGTERFCSMLSTEPIAKRLETIVLRGANFSDDVGVALGRGYPSLQHLEISGLVSADFVDYVTNEMSSRVRKLIIEPLEVYDDAWDDD